MKLFRIPPQEMRVVFSGPVAVVAEEVIPGLDLAWRTYELTPTAEEGPPTLEAGAPESAAPDPPLALVPLVPELSPDGEAVEFMISFTFDPFLAVINDAFLPISLNAAAAAIGGMQNTKAVPRTWYDGSLRLKYVETKKMSVPNWST